MVRSLSSADPAPSRAGQLVSRWIFPSVADLLFLVCLLTAVSQPGPLLSTDGDPARQLTIGEYIISTGTLPRSNLFSHTLADEPFVPYEWLAEVVNALTYRAFGLAGMALVHGALVGLTFSVLFVALRARGHGFLLSTAVVVYTAF